MDAYQPDTGVIDSYHRILGGRTHSDRELLGIPVKRLFRLELCAAVYRRIILNISGARILAAQRRVSRRDTRAQRSVVKTGRVSDRVGRYGRADLLSTSWQRTGFDNTLAGHYSDSDIHCPRVNVSDFCPVRNVP